MIDWIIFCIPVVAFWFSGVTGIPQRIKFINRKPFNCAKCFAFWLAFVYQMNLGYHGWSAWMLICGSSFFAWIIERIMIRFNIFYNK